MPSLIDRLRQLQKKTAPLPAASKPSADETIVSPRREAGDYLRAVADKMMKLAEDFAEGRANRAQFEELYRHYLQERATIEKMIQERPTSAAWKEAVTQGESVLIRRKHAAMPLGYAIYLNVNSTPLRSVGDFKVDAALLVPMLSAYRSAAAEIFGAGLKSSQIEGGRWMCFVPGTYTTLIVVFSVEPARLQMELLEQLHLHFERANQRVFETGIPDPARLVYPHAAAFE
jgi:hypothetical protein